MRQVIVKAYVHLRLSKIHWVLMCFDKFRDSVHIFLLSSVLSIAESQQIFSSLNLSAIGGGSPPGLPCHPLGSQALSLPKVVLLMSDSWCCSWQYEVVVVVGGGGGDPPCNKPTRPAAPDSPFPSPKVQRHQGARPSHQPELQSQGKGNHHHHHHHLLPIKRHKQE